jgi:hypothetical protein
MEIGILTNVKTRDASAAKIADLLPGALDCEGLFLTLTQILNGEIPRSGRRRRCSHSVALVSYNIASVSRSTSATFGGESVEEVSWYYVAGGSCHPRRNELFMGRV